MWKGTEAGEDEGKKGNDGKLRREDRKQETGTKSARKWKKRGNGKGIAKGREESQSKEVKPCVK